MNRKSTTLTISAVAFIAALLIDLYLIFVYPSMIQVIIAVSLIVVVDKGDLFGCKKGRNFPHANDVCTS